MIFICDFDPLGRRKYRYTMEHICREVPDLPYRDGSHTIFLSTYGENETEVPETLVNFLRYVRGILPDPEDSYVKRLQDSVRQVKASREMEERFMVLQEMMRLEREEGRAEGRAESVLVILEESGPVPEDVQERILSEDDLSVLNSWIRLAAASDSVESFVKKAF